MTIKLSLPDDIAEKIQTFAAASVSIRRGMMRELRDYMDEFIDHNYRMAVYTLIADYWNSATGENKSARTIRAWMDSVTVYSKEQLQRYSALSDAQLIEACKLANDCQNVTAQDICDWCVDRGIGSVRQMRANWLPQTSTEYAPDHPVISGLLRGINKNWQSHPRYSRILRIVNLLRAEIKAIQEKGN